MISILFDINEMQQKPIKKKQEPFFDEIWNEHYAYQLIGLYNIN